MIVHSGRLARRAARYRSSGGGRVIRITHPGQIEDAIDAALSNAPEAFWDDLSAITGIPKSNLKGGK
jgi:hypothetical protein